MAGRSVSPGAALLRSSRMFSMPPPIPPPPGDYSSATRHYSPTSTIAFPTHQTVTTTSASRMTGDWGFKRPLPLKTTTNTSLPLARVRQVDSSEHVTDFQSASDHTITLMKYQELNLPISVPSAATRKATHKATKSVFEEESDVTALDDTQKKTLISKRWKFTGPWLAGMTDGDFYRYLEKKVRGRRPEFRAFLKEALAAEMTAKEAKNAREAGETEMPPPKTADMVTDEELTDYLRVLRVERVDLYNLVSQFLDLAPVDLDVSLRLLGKFMPDTARTFKEDSPYSQSGPPTTHPSAGLSYLRTRNFLENHAIYGPQKYHAPAKARVLKPVNLNTNSPTPSIGTAGFVVNTMAVDNKFNAARGRAASKFQKSMHGFDFETHGGAKVYVDPASATVTSAGRVVVNVDEPAWQAELVAKELAGELRPGESVLEQVQKARDRQQELANIPRNPMSWSGGPGRFSARPGSRLSGSASSYGLKYLP